MKAIVHEKFGGPEVLQLKEVNKPVPKDNEVLIKTHCTSINPFEWHHMRGEPFLGRLSMGLFKPKHPILGMDVAGVIETVGQEIKEFKPGDAVFGYCDFGGLAEYVCIPVERVVHKPKNLSFAEVAAIPIAGITALQSLKNVVQLAAGQKVLINGSSGGVGTYAVQVAREMGLHITGVCSTPNVALVKSLGAQRVIDYKKESVLQSGERYDLVIDNVGNLSLKDIKQLLNKGGTGVVVGFTTFKNILPILLKGKPAKGKIGVLSCDMNKVDLQYLAGLMAEGKVKSIIDRYYPLEEIVDAMNYLETLHAPGKVIINVNHV